jgi:hypothetical protein
VVLPANLVPAAHFNESGLAGVRVSTSADIAAQPVLSYGNATGTY